MARKKRQSPIVVRNGMWFADYREDGQRVRYSLKLRADEADERSALDRFRKLERVRKSQLERKRNERGLPGGRAYRIDAAISDFLRSRDRHPRTEEKYTYVLELLQSLLTEHGKEHMHEINEADVQAYGNWRIKQYVRRQGRATQQRVRKVTANSELRSIRAFLYDTRRFLSEDPHEWFKHNKPMFRVQKAEIRVFSRREVDAILEQASSPFREVYRFMNLTGSRVEETTQLRWKWVNFEKGVITFDGSITKGGKTRSFPLYTELRAFLESLDAERQSRSKEDLVFPSNANKPLQRSSISRHLKGIIKQNGWEHGTPHDFRRTFCSRMARRIQPAQLMSLTGHENYQTMYDCYYKDQVTDGTLDALQADFNSTEDNSVME